MPLARADKRETAHPRFDHMILGSVVDRDDPEGLGRIRVHVPGLLEPSSAWALPLGAMYGVKNGIHWVPEVGANAVVFFNQGDEAHPYYMAGPYGAPEGETDVPDEAPNGSVDHMVIRWRDFVITLNGKAGEEKASFEDRETGTKLEVTRATGNFERTVDGPQGDEVATIKRHLTETAGGNEQHTVAGNRTTGIGGNDTKTVGGNETDTVTGNRTKTIAGTKTETVGTTSSELVGVSKAIVAGLNVAITAGGAVNVLAGGAVTLVGAGTTMQSTAGGNSIAAGLQTNTFLGGINETVVGNVNKTVAGNKTEAVTGTHELSGAILKLIAAEVKLGIEAATKKLVTRDLFTLWANIHSHAGLGSPPTEKIVPAASPPDVDELLVQTANVEAS